MTAKAPTPMPEGAIRPKAPCAPPPKKGRAYEIFKLIEGEMVDVTPDEPRKLSPAMQDLADRWAGTPHGEFLFPKAETVR